MNLTNINTLLFAGKWAFISLVYLILITVVIAVRREMMARTGAPNHSQAGSRTGVSQSTPGVLRVVRAGGDPHLRPGAALPLKPETRLGAEPDNDLVLNDRFVSGRHARMHWDGANWWIEDLGSTNGTKLDGRPCLPHLPQLVPPGSRLALGDIEFEMSIT